MTDYTKLIERLRDNTARHDDESRRLCNEAAEAIEALQAENERLKAEKAGLEHVKNAFGLQMQTLQSKLDAMGKGEPVAIRYKLQGDMNWQYTENRDQPTQPCVIQELLAAPKALEPEPLIKFRHGCKWCGKAKCAAGCHGIGGTP